MDESRRSGAVLQMQVLAASSEEQSIAQEKENPNLHKGPVAMATTNRIT